MKRNKIRILKYVVFGAIVLCIFMVSMSSFDLQENKAIDSDVLPKFENIPSVEKIDWHNYSAISKELLRSGPGEQGTGVQTSSENAQEKNRLFSSNGFNALASDMISLHRAIKDIRHHDCRKMKYNRVLPTVSIIIPFYDEHWSTLLRTFVSAIERSPPNLIKEVILVDDCSTKDFLKEKLDTYLAENYPNRFVYVLRQPTRQGLIRTRLLGAKAAKGDVLIFLDSHCESNTNWLPPLLDPIASDYKTVVCPFIDVIDYETFAYRAQDEGARGAFDWHFYYKRLPRRPEDAQHPAEPFVSPVMAGGLFAISAKWFWELGGYDSGLEIWGGEQYELSFKIWQCGGRMVDTPCSRIGHVYRKFSPFPNPPGLGDFLGRNYKRVALVWMDDWIEYIYKRRPHYRSLDAGNLTEQRALRKRLNCKSFDWFMKEIAFDLTKRYPAVEPDRLASGSVYLKNSQIFCLTTNTPNNKLSLQRCSKRNGQKFELTYHKDIRPYGSAKCLDCSEPRDGGSIVLYDCHHMMGNQEWRYDVYNHLLHHPASSRCLEANTRRMQVFVSVCDSNNPDQMWQWDTVNEKEAKKLLL